MDVAKLTRTVASLVSEMDELEGYAQGNPGEARMREVQLSAERLMDDARKLARLAATLAKQAEAECVRLFHEENMAEAA